MERTLAAKLSMNCSSSSAKLFKLKGWKTTNTRLSASNHSPSFSLPPGISSSYEKTYATRGVRTHITPHWQLHPILKKSAPCSLRYGYPESTDSGQREGDAVNEDYSEGLQESLGTLPTMTALNRGKFPYSEFLHISLAVFPSEVDVTSSSHPIENALSPLQHPKFCIFLLKAQGKYLKRCAYIEEGIVKKMENFRIRMSGTIDTLDLKVASIEQFSTI